MADLTVLTDHNIGPGPNSIASILTDKPAALTESEKDYLWEQLRDEDGDHLYHIAGFLSATRHITVRLAGAHHQIEDLGDEAEPYTVCIFCGEDYHWRVRCPVNRGGHA
jgi:hypothetical protein